MARPKRRVIIHLQRPLFINFDIPFIFNLSPIMPLPALKSNILISVKLSDGLFIDNSRIEATLTGDLHFNRS